MRVVVFGLGLLGGSVCKALRSLKGDLYLSAYDRDRGSLETALNEKIIDEIIDNPAAHLSCDIVIVALPVKSSIGVIRTILDMSDDKTLIIDLGSVKKGVIDGVIAHPRSSRFVPCHPMAGSERSGYVHSSAEIIRGAKVIITPHQGNSSESIDRVRHFWESIGLVVTIADPSAHDAAVALTSHMPHIVAGAIVLAADKGSPKNLAMDAFRGKGFRDMTRLAEGAPNVWEEICSMNASQIADALGRVIEELGEIRNALNADPVDESAVRKYLERAADVKKEIRNA